MSKRVRSIDNILLDFSLWSLLFSNLITIFFATKEGWNLLTLMWIFWFQSITIGLFNFIRILRLKKFSTSGLKINNQPAQPSKSTKTFTAFFFLVHYGLFHFFYLIYLFFISIYQIVGLHGHISTTLVSTPLDMRFVYFTALVFFVNHLFSFIYNAPKDTKKQNIGTLMFYPYARVIPMHLTILLGDINAKNSLIFFLSLKTFSDILMHVIEHKIRRGENRENLN